VPVEDDCLDPQEVKGEVSRYVQIYIQLKPMCLITNVVSLIVYDRLNKEILRGFIKLVGDLVNKPLDHE